MPTASMIRVLAVVSVIAVMVAFPVLPAGADSGDQAAVVASPADTTAPLHGPVTAAPGLAGPVPPALPTLPQGPPSNAQVGEPSVPAPPCSWPALGSAEIRMVFDRVFAPAENWWWGGSLAVDPNRPCHMYTTANALTNSSDAGYPFTVYRGDIGSGTTTWNAVFTVPEEPEDSGGLAGAMAPAYQPVPAVAADGSVWLPTVTRSVAGFVRAFRSSDIGWHWSERDQGLAVQSPNNLTARFLPSPSDPATAYLLTSGGTPMESGGPAFLHVTTDAGQTWSTLALPMDASGDAHETDAAAMMVDPFDAARLFFLAPVANNLDPVYPAIWQSRDGGHTWSFAAIQGQLPLGGDIDASFATPGVARQPVLYIHVDSTLNSAATGHWFRSTDLGLTWHLLPLPDDAGSPRPGVPGSFLAADPANPDILVWTRGGNLSPQNHALDVLATTDGFRSGTVQALRITVPASDGVAADNLLADSSGDFFLAVDRQGDVSDPTYGPRRAATIVAFRATAVSNRTVPLNAAAIAAGPVLTGPISSGSLLPVSSPSARQPAQDCQLLSGTGGGFASGAGGTLAFDGRYLDFAQTTTAPGIIFRADAATCRQAPLLTLHASDFPSGTLPTIQALSYDTTYRWPGGGMGAILFTAPPGFDSRLPVTSVPVYAVDPATATSVLFLGVNTTGGCPNGGPGTTNACGVTSFFSFDEFKQGIWSLGTPPGGGGPNDPHPSFVTVDGAVHDNCFSTFVTYDPALKTYANWSGVIAAAVVGGDGYLYVAREDDATIDKIRESDCATVDRFSHANLGENAVEEEQIACDPLTLGAPVLWMRNSTTDDVVGYSVPDAYCPFPTRLSYDSGPRVVRPGSTSTFCFTLDVALDGRWQPLGGQPITVRVGGVTAGQPLTDPGGHACLTTAAPVSPGSTAVQAKFAGTQAYLPSGAEGTMVVLPTGAGLSIGGLALPGPGIAVSAPIQPGNAPQPNGVDSPSSAASTSAESEAQVQAQSQAQAQSVSQAQPGVMVQREKRIQLATNEQRAAASTLRATAARRSPPAPGFAVAAGLMLAGLGLAARRLRAAPARRRR